MNIRRANAGDMDRIKDLLNQVLMVHHNGRPDIFKANCRKYTDDELAELIKDDTRPIFVAEDGEVVGYAFCIIQQYIDNNILTDIKTLYIDDLCVDENVRGKHIGTLLYNYVKNYARETGCYNLTLNVWECNESAKKFYEKQGLTAQKTNLETIL
ncbi:MAG: GNAT family N-acetyltransferase [Clostridia bacterium]|nr:GNAT family N-acetyltransferase [Clostridia bacterium]